jgi:hypothetical protein
VTRSLKTAVAVDAGVYAGYVRDLRQELLEPPEFVLCDEPLRPPGSGRGRVTGDGVADWLQCVETAFVPDGERLLRG